MQRQRVLSNKEKHVAAKLVKRFRGPLKIVKVLSPLVYLLEGNNGVNIKSAVRGLKPYKSSANFGDEDLE